MLPNAKCLEYRDFRWDVNDFPGNGGPNANKNPPGKSEQMMNDLKTVFPERRPHAGATAVVLSTDIKGGESSPNWKKIVDQLTTVPGFPAKKLNKDAAESFAKMRESCNTRWVKGFAN